MGTSIQRNGLENAITLFVDRLPVPKRSLIGAEASGKRMILTYSTDTDIEKMSPVFATIKLEENCRDSIFGSIAAAGGEVVSIYMNTNQKEIGRIVTNEENC